MNDLVSVVIPTYKRPLYIERAIESVINQTYDNIEIIIVDDNGLGSENQRNTEKVLEKYIINKKIKYIINKENVGGAVSRNNGVAHASGKFISFLDDDDTYEPNKIMEQLKIITSDKATDACYCGMSYINEKGIKIGKRSIYLDGSSDLLSRHIYRPITGTPALLIKRSVFDDINGFDPLKRYQDANLIFKLLANGSKFKCVKKELVNVFLHSEERITNPVNRIKLELEYIENNLKYLDKMTYNSSKLLIDKYHMLKILSTQNHDAKKILKVIKTINFRMFNWMNLLGFANYIMITLKTNQDLDNCRIQN
ncbi:glycosyltransferase family 2 protein [Soehngenia longivitae]|uniref:Glycosyltransferase family 2 protein n=1 Tax=Soehngenia longivitae TaxID=2562294 RepID=A0A4Z0D8M6_9FIRM|nr:glycosyltransferase family A protein [Soehngenia longivitae]TFZ41213.1 glycosyltransferase family 2 protein [Soehngenia longivitae]